MDVYDLDGTVFPGNTFTRFVVFVFIRLLGRGQCSESFRLAAAVVLRKLRRITHHELKLRAVEASTFLRDADLANFIEGISRSCEARLSILRRRHGRAPCSVLATAAPNVYADALAKRLGFDHFIASGFRDGQYIETIRECKRDRVLELAARLGRHVSTVFTDHLDDISLALVSAQVVLVDASAEMLEAVTSSGKSMARVDFRRRRPADARQHR